MRIKVMGMMMLRKPDLMEVMNVRTVRNTSYLKRFLNDNILVMCIHTGDISMFVLFETTGAL